MILRKSNKTIRDIASIYNNIDRVHVISKKLQFPVNESEEPRGAKSTSARGGRTFQVPSPFPFLCASLPLPITQSKIMPVYQQESIVSRRIANAFYLTCSEFYLIEMLVENARDSGLLKNTYAYRPVNIFDRLIKIAVTNDTSKK